MAVQRFDPEAVQEIRKTPSVAVGYDVKSELCGRFLAISCREHSSRGLDCKPSDQSFPEPGGKSLNILATPLSRFFHSSRLATQIVCAFHWKSIFAIIPLSDGSVGGGERQTLPGLRV